MSSLKMPLSRIVTAVQSDALAHVSELIPPGAYQFHVAKLIDAIEKDYSAYQKQNTALVRKYGRPDKDEKGNATLTMAGVSAENVEAFSLAMQELLNAETLIPYKPISFAKLGPEAQKLTINDVRALGPLMVEDDEAPAVVEPPKA